MIKLYIGLIRREGGLFSLFIWMTLQPYSGQVLYYRLPE